MSKHQTETLSPFQINWITHALKTGAELAIQHGTVKQQQDISYAQKLFDLSLSDVPQVFSDYAIDEMNALGRHD
jgi:hypothetical protein